MSNNSFDGLCGIINLYATSDNQVRCKYEFGHSGPHSWAKIITHIIGGITHEEVEHRRKK